MEFIIQNIGWFVGIGLVLLLALIGYFADKGEQKKISADNNTKSINPNSSHVDQNDVVNSDLESVVPDVVNSLDSGFINNNESNSINISSESSSNNLNDNKTDVIDDRFKNIEDTHMSLADLEKKNYSEILNSRVVPEYNYVDDNEISDYVDSKNIIDDVMNVVDNTLNVSETDSSIIDDQNVSRNDNVENFTNIDDMISVSQNDTIQSTISNELSEVTEDELFNNEVDLNTSVPELVDSNISNNVYNNVSDSNNEDGVLDLYDDSLDDDIWKF